MKNYWVFSNQYYKYMQQLNIAIVNIHYCMCPHVEELEGH